MTLLRLYIILMIISVNIPIAMAHDYHPLSMTPAYQNALIFGIINNNDKDDIAAMNYFKNIVTDQNYKVVEYIDTNYLDKDPEKATLLNFLLEMEKGDKGLIFIRTLGGSSGGSPIIMVEAYNTAEDRDAMYNKYLELGIISPDSITDCDFAINKTNVYGICVNDDYLKNLDFIPGIVHIASCFSMSLDIGATEFFGYNSLDVSCQDISSDIVRSDTELLWGRMSDITGENRRSASMAYYGGGLSERFDYMHQATRPIVLSPAIKSVWPPFPTIIPLNSETSGVVIFDTKMDKTKDANKIITIEGCDVEIKKKPHWFTLGPGYSDDIIFTFEFKSEGDAIIRVHQEDAVAEFKFKNNLDGNQIPLGGFEHTGPNRDNYVWKLYCEKGTNASVPHLPPGDIICTECHGSYNTTYVYKGTSLSIEFIYILIIILVGITFITMKRIRWQHVRRQFYYDKYKIRLRR